MSRIKILAAVLVLLLVVVGSYALAYRFGLISLPCRNQYGFPLKTGKISKDFKVAVGYMETIDTAFCYLGTDIVQDQVFPDSSLRIKIGFFDKFGILKVYPARIGAQALDGNIIPVGYCVNDQNGMSCNSIKPSEIVTKITPSSVIVGSIVFNDSSPWKVSELVQKYSVFMNKFVSSFERNSQIPSAPKDLDFVLQVVKFTVSQ